MRKKKKMKTELLAPAGNKEAFISAIHHGASAIYIGGLQYGARSQAQNFTTEEIKEMINYAHLYNVKVYVTVNTLIKDSEFDDAVNFVKELYINNVDAIIVQDIGLATYLLKVFPDITLHASTQMNIHSIEQAQFIKSLGFKRIILARECSIEVIKQIKENIDIEVEVFVHGALCMSYSGNCLMSSIIGKRSGNRGKCAQPCRLLYSLNESKPSYLLSPKDLMTLDNLYELLQLNIDSLKIEGRMKRAEYVGLVTEIYSKAIESYYDNRQYDKEAAVKELKEMFNREFTKGYMFKVKNINFTNTKFSNHIGVKLGTVIKKERNYIFVKLEDKLEKNDSIRIVGKIDDAVTISEMYINNVLVKKASKGDIVKIRCHKELMVDSLVLKTTNYSLINRLQNYVEKKILIDGKVFVKENKLVLQVKYDKYLIEELSSVEVESSENDNFKNRLYEQINKTNSTIYKFKILDIDVKNIFLPISIVNELRRRALEKLSIERLKFANKRVEEYVNEPLRDNNENFEMAVKVNTMDQYEAVKGLFNGTVITENRNLYHIIQNDNKVIYLNPRIEVGKLISGGIQNYNLIGNNHLFIGNYFNVFNSYTLEFYHRLGINKVGLSVELSSDEIKQLINSYYKRNNAAPNTFIMVYGRYELMLMKHCLINKQLKLDYLGCNKCSEKQYYLEDRLGFKFPLVRTEGCVLKLLNSKIVNLINNLDEIKSNGVNGIILDFTIESKEQTHNIIEAYIRKLHGEDVKLNINDVTYGHFNEGVL